MKRAICFLADGFEMAEALCTVDVLRRAGIRCVTASIKGERSVTSSHGVTVLADFTIDEVGEDGWDCVFCPGGMPGATNLRDCTKVGRTVMAAYRSGHIVSAICASPAVVFGPLGILDGRKATCYPGCEEYAPSVTFSSDGVVRDGSVVTAKSAGWAFDLGLELVRVMEGAEKSRAVQDSIYYK